jgi:hypothetical protein
LERGIEIESAAYLSKVGTLGSVIGSILTYHYLHWLPWVVLLVYSLSPLGSQAVLRFVSIARMPMPSISVQYIYPNASGLLDTSDDAFWTGFASAFLISSIVSEASINGRPQDNWGNIRIPVYELLDASTVDKEGYIKIPSTNGTNYTSLIGIPISMNTGNFTSTFTLHSWYWAFQESNLTNPLPSGQVTGYEGAYLTNLTNDAYWLTHTAPSQTFQIAVSQEARRNGTLPIPFWFQDSNPLAGSGLDNITNFWTTVTPSFVESNVTCTQATCAVTAIRKTAPTQSAMDLNVITFSEWFLYDFLRATGIAHSGTAEQGLLEAYLNTLSSNPVLLFENALQANITLSAVGAEHLSLRLNALLNTYWMIWNTLSTASGAFSTNYDYLSSLQLNKNLMNTTATVEMDGFFCSGAWLFTLCFATSAMIVASLISIRINLIRVGTHDYTDFVSVLTHSRFDHPEMESSSHVHDTLKRLSGIKVQIGDGCLDDPVGKIVLAEKCDSIGKLTKRRLYR